MKTVIAELGRDVYEGFKTRNEAALVLWELSEIPVSIAFDMIERERKRIVNIQCQIDTMEQQEDEDNARYEREYRIGASL